MGQVYIKWQYLNLNDDEFNPSNDTIELSCDVSQNAATQMEEKSQNYFQYCLVKYHLLN